MMGKQEKTTAATPRLRFPEFREAGEWVLEELADVCEILNNRRLPISSEERRAGPYPYYGASGIVDFVDGFIFDERLVLVGEDGAKWGAFEATAFIAEGKYWVNNHAHVLKPIAVIDTVLQNYLTMIDLAGYVTGHAPPKLTLAKLKSIPIVLPALKLEQQKIADCLTSLDELIGAEGRKVEALKAHKRGLMQQLFPREGETTPRLRFPEFRSSPAWEDVPLRAFASYENGKAYEQDIVEEGQFVVVNSRFISTNGAVLKYTNAEYCTAAKNDVLMVLSDLPNGKALAKCFLVDTDDRYAVNQRVARLTPTDVDPAFFYFRLNRSPRLLVFDDGLSQTHLSKGNVQDCLLCVPREQKEQQRIADCLTSLDELIAAQSRKVEALKAHKRGLMQQLFPVPEAT